MFQIEIHCNADRGAVEHTPPSWDEWFNTQSRIARLEPGWHITPIDPPPDAKTVEAVIGPAFSFAESIAYSLDETDRMRIVSRVLDLAETLGRGQ